MIDELKQLVLGGGFDDESKQNVLYWEEKLHEISVKENILQHQPVKQWFDWMAREVSQARLLLSTDPELTNDQRTELFIRIDIANKYLSLLDISDKEKIEEDIRNALTVAKNQIEA